MVEQGLGDRVNTAQSQEDRLREELASLRDQRTRQELTANEMKAQQAGDQHNLLVARNQYDQALLALKNLMNFPPDEELSVSNEDLDVSADLIPIPELIYNTALQHMPSIKQADFNADAAQKQLSIARGELLPRLSLGAGIYTNYADSRREYLNPGNPENSATRTVPFKNQWEQNMAQSIYLSLQIPIFNKWNGMTQVKRAHLQRTIATKSPSRSADGR